MIKTNEYISRDDLYRDAYWAEAYSDFFAAQDVLYKIENFPAADVAPVRHGTWKGAEGRDSIECSSCGFCMFPLAAYKKGEWPNMRVTDDENLQFIPRFCPDCGAKMNLWVP